MPAWYRNEQVKLPGPINIYGARHVLLFVRGCADHRRCKHLRFEFPLSNHNTNTDYCYHIAELCQRVPSYMNKQRSLATVRLFLESQHLRLAARYTLKVNSAYEGKMVKKWARRTSVESGAHRPHWLRYSLQRIQVV